jgi:hypothetical protein
LHLSNLPSFAVIALSWSVTLITYFFLAVPKSEFQGIKRFTFCFGQVFSAIKILFRLLLFYFRNGFLSHPHHLLERMFATFFSNEIDVRSFFHPLLE